MRTGSGLTTKALALNLANMHKEIARACRRAARDPAEVRLIAVSKGHEFSKIKALYDLGQRDFGESYAQEFIKKYELATTMGLKITWHFIGALQSNKLKLIKHAHYVHSVGSLRHAELLQAAVKSDLSIFLQVNLVQAGARQGVLVEDVVNTIKALTSYKKLILRGLMTIIPQHTNHKASFWFEKMAALRNSILKLGLLEEVSLSMGMSDDFVEAIEYGAHFVRIGTKIFGPRDDNDV